MCFAGTKYDFEFKVDHKLVASQDEALQAPSALTYRLGGVFIPSQRYLCESKFRKLNWNEK